MSFFLNFPGQRAAMNNAMRLERRGRLIADWEKANFVPGSVDVPWVSLRGRIYFYRMMLSKTELPVEYQAQWLDDDAVDTQDQPEQDIDEQYNDSGKTSDSV